MNIKPEEITSIIKREIERYEKKIQTVDSGTIIQIGDGIARVYGLDDCMEGELLAIGRPSENVATATISPSYSKAYL